MSKMIQLEPGQPLSILLLMSQNASVCPGSSAAAWQQGANGEAGLNILCVALCRAARYVICQKLLHQQIFQKFEIYPHCNKEGDGEAAEHTMRCIVQ